jgi:hypothetical protein
MGTGRAAAACSRASPLLFLACGKRVQTRCQGSYLISTVSPHSVPGVRRWRSDPWHR